MANQAKVQAVAELADRIKRAQSIAQDMLANKSEEQLFYHTELEKLLKY